MTLVQIERGKNVYDGNPLNLIIHEKLAQNLKVAYKRVTQKNWDYVAVVAGLPGAGKSTFVRGPARFLCPWFNESYVAFTDKEFIQMTNTVPEYSSVVLDESFASLNTQVNRTPEFLRIINHLQLIRQRHLFIFLCLPNFFDLSKGVGVFRASHLFLVYSGDDGRRGEFRAYDRERKRRLYVKGYRYLDYACVSANYNGRFALNTGVVDEQKYEERKREHLLAQSDQLEKNKKVDIYWKRNNIIAKLKLEHGWKCPELAKLSGIGEVEIRSIVADYKKRTLGGNVSPN